MKSSVMKQGTDALVGTTVHCRSIARHVLNMAYMCQGGDIPM